MLQYLVVALISLVVGLLLKFLVKLFYTPDVVVKALVNGITPWTIVLWLLGLIHVLCMIISAVCFIIALFMFL